MKILAWFVALIIACALAVLAMVGHPVEFLLGVLSAFVVPFFFKKMVAANDDHNKNWAQAVAAQTAILAKSAKEKAIKANEAVEAAFFADTPTVPKAPAQPLYERPTFERRGIPPPTTLPKASIIPNTGEAPKEGGRPKFG